MRQDHWFGSADGSSHLGGGPNSRPPSIGGSERFAIFSSPAAFWAATISLVVATAVLLVLICTFLMMAFKRRVKPWAARGGGGGGGGDDEEEGVGQEALEGRGLVYPLASAPGGDGLVPIGGGVVATTYSKMLRLAPFTGG